MKINGPGAFLMCAAVIVNAASAFSEQSAQPRESVDVPAAAVRELFLDGSGRDAIWQSAKALPPLLLDEGRAEDASRSSRVQILRTGPWLILGIDATEPDGIVAREALHGADLWFDDAFSVELKAAKNLSLMVNPFGTVWCSRDGKADFAPIQEQQVRAAARIEAGRWRVEVAIDLRMLGAAVEQPAQLEARVYRQRQLRGTTPFENAAFPAAEKGFAALNIGAATGEVSLTVASPQRFVEPTVFEVTRTAAAPDETAWSALPATVLLGENGPSLDPEFQRTELRGALTPDALILKILCRENFPETNPGKELWSRDNLEIFVGPEGFPFLQIACDAGGALNTVRGKTGGKHPQKIPVPDGIRADAGKSADHWAVTVTIPADAVHRALSLPLTHRFESWPWRVQVLRNRTARSALGQAAQASQLAVTRSATAHCPQRFALLRPVEKAAAAAPVAPDLPPPVLTDAQRRELKAPGLLQEWLAARTKATQRSHEERFAKISSADEWNSFASTARERLLKSVFPGADGALPERTPLNARTVFTHKGEGFRVEGIVFETLPGLPSAATVYAPDAPPEAGPLAKVGRPALILIPAHHTPRNSLDLQIVGMTMARAGCVVLATEGLGSGERSLSARWEHKSYQSNLVGAQLSLAGEEVAGWTAWEISRTVDYLLQRGDIDGARVGLMGGVAGGGDISALGAAIDDRITLSIPFNFSTTSPFGGYWDPTRTYPGAHAGGITAWMVGALIAPRHQINAQEFAWTTDCQERYARFQKIYGLLGAEQNIAFVHGGPETHATHFNHMHRLPVYKILNRWWGTSLPEDRALEYTKKIPEQQLECFTTPAGRKFLAGLRESGKLREPQAIALKNSAARLAAAREQRRASGRTVQQDLRQMFNIGPAPIDADAIKSAGTLWRGWKVDNIWLPAEPEGKLGIAIWLISPAEAARRPLTVCVAQAGKAQFLLERAAQVEALLKSGVSVALLDVRGCGETSPGVSRFPEGQSAELATVAWMQDDALPARQLNDVLTALRHLTKRDDVDAERLALWGEGLTPANGKADEQFLFDETGFRQTSPTPKHLAEPLGGWLAMTAALYPVELAERSVRVRAVLARGTLVSFASMLERRHYYVPQDAIVPGILNIGDAGDLATALKNDKIELLAEDLRDGSNRGVDFARVHEDWKDAAPSVYSNAPTDGAVATLARLLTK